MDQNRLNISSLAELLNKEYTNYWREFLN
jgi:hypothetical protein